MRVRRSSWWLLSWMWSAAACDERPPLPVEDRCPVCECACEGTVVVEPVQAIPPGPPPVTHVPPTAEIGELVASAMRKMNFDDGKGCLADLDELHAIDPKVDARLAVTRGMCEMLIGRCQEGKQRVARWYQEETNMHPERAAATAESLAGMRCRGGDSTDRDRLLRAYFELSDGAYMNKRSAADCKAALDVARALIPRVKPQGPEDSQIRDSPQALFHTAATCLGRAGDCQAALAVYREFYPSLASVKDPAMRAKIVQDSFNSSIAHCAQAKTP
ncbi:hypothetical protein [Nannocystis punicea]|uniref:Tetratricopeptide repeat protein n=1 Tax=Nannocystis punicea TaxID=2995304 RepID=A0ABY7GXF9_9BACT|nr:hypothetical protein [Nannocystis poenicansa]WAS91662.1 hypothetical protein O0S08_36230 [Nannocystis poenicansa]